MGWVIISDVKGNPHTTSTQLWGRSTKSWPPYPRQDNVWPLFARSSIYALFNSNNPFAHLFVPDVAAANQRCWTWRQDSRTDSQVLTTLEEKTFFAIKCVCPVSLFTAVIYDFDGLPELGNEESVLFFGMAKIWFMVLTFQPQSVFTRCRGGSLTQIFSLYSVFRNPDRPPIEVTQVCPCKST